MAEEFCHICKDGGRECVNITDERSVAFMKFAPKCSKCGRPLVP